MACKGWGKYGGSSWCNVHGLTVGSGCGPMTIAMEATRMAEMELIITLLGGSSGEKERRERSRVGFFGITLSFKTHRVGMQYNYLSQRESHWHKMRECVWQESNILKNVELSLYQTGESAGHSEIPDIPKLIPIYAPSLITVKNKYAMPINLNLDRASFKL